MNRYVVERADGHCYRITSQDPADDLLLKLRSEYILRDNVFSTFTPHVNRIPVAIYFEVARLSNNE